MFSDKAHPIVYFITITGDKANIRVRYCIDIVFVSVLHATIYNKQICIQQIRKYLQCSNSAFNNNSAYNNNNDIGEHLNWLYVHAEIYVNRTLV